MLSILKNAAVGVATGSATVATIGFSGYIAGKYQENPSKGEMVYVPNVGWYKHEESGEGSQKGALRVK